MQTSQITPAEMDITLRQAAVIRSAHVTKGCKVVFDLILELAASYQAARHYAIKNGFVD